MRLSTAFLPVAGTFVLAKGVQLESNQNPNLVPASLNSRSPDPDLGDILDDLPALISDIVSTGVSIAKALKEAVKNDALVRNDLDDVLRNAPNVASPVVTSLVPEPTETPSDIQLEARQDQNNKGDQSTTPGTASCPDVAILYAKGAKEPGNVGFLVGPPFFAALETYINGTSALAVQGINYEASTVSGAVTDGSDQMADLVRRTMEACPDSRMTLAGYSRGASVVRSTLEQMGAPNATDLGAVTSVVLFGDHRSGEPVPVVDAARVMSFCHENDIFCNRPGSNQADDGPVDGNDGTSSPGADAGGRRSKVGAHLDYSLDAPAAAMFVMQRSGLGMASTDAMDQGMAGTLAGMAQEISRNGVDGING